MMFSLKVNRYIKTDSSYFGPRFRSGLTNLKTSGLRKCLLIKNKQVTQSYGSGPGVLGHFCHGHFGHGRFGTDISATDVSAMDVSAIENAEGGRLVITINFGLGCMHAFKCVMHFLIF